LTFGVGEPLGVGTTVVLVGLVVVEGEGAGGLVRAKVAEVAGAGKWGR
jgi:hypothetical protein